MKYPVAVRQRGYRGLAPRGASGLKYVKHRKGEKKYGLAPRGASGLKFEMRAVMEHINCLAPRGASGLKYLWLIHWSMIQVSGSARS